MDEADTTSPFHGIRVIDFTQGIAGPTATMYLADFGADVLKLEPPEGDRAADDPVYVCCNRGKRRATLDLTDHRHLSELRRLLGTADCFVVDWDLADLERLGLDSASVRADHPHLIHAWIPPLGAVGRWCHLPPDPLFLAAVSGIADYHKATVERPVSPVVPVETYAHGALAAAGIAAALLERTKSGTGRSLVVSGLHAVAAMQAAVVVDAPGIVSPGLEPKRGLASLPNYAPYRCADGKWLYVGALTQAFFLATLEVLDMLDIMVLLGVDGEFANVLKPDVAPMLIDRLQSRFSEQTRAEWLEALDNAGVPVAPVEDRQDWFDSETVAANGMRVTQHHPRLGTVEMPGVPVVLSRSPGRPGGPMTDVPHLGKHWKDAAPRTQPQATIEPGIPEADRPLPLRGLKVVDAASFVAGTFGPSILAHYGASVVKLEPPEGDPYRLFSASFAAINQGKQGMVLDLKSEAGRAALTAMLQRADVFVENFRGRSRIQLGLEWDVLEKSNPRLVHCSVGAYGAGPLSDKPGFDPLLQARSGLIAAQGGPDEPSGSTMLVHDIGTGTMAAVGILAALYERESSARGQHVTTSLANSSLMLQAGEFTRYRHRPEPRLGCRDWPGPSPSQRLYRCADGWIFLDATEAGFDSVARALDLDVPRNSVSFEDVERALGDMPTVPALDRLSMKGVAAAKVLSRHDAFRDPWLLENRFYHVISDRALGRCRVIRTVTDWPESTDVPTKRSFLIGEDTREVLGSYRFSDTEISSLIESGVCVEVPVDGSSSRLA